MKDINGARISVISAENKEIQQEDKHRGFSIRKLRFWVQLFGVAVTLWIGVEFILFVNYLETGGETAFVSRPPGVESFLPISAMISLRDWVITGVLNTIHPASVIIFLAIILASFLFKKAFCSWVCPVGFISEMIGNIGDKIVGFFWKDKRLKLPWFLDYPLRSVKYLLLLFFVWAVFYSMTSTQIREFVSSPYNKVADIKMLKFFTEIDPFGLWTIIILFALSIVFRGFWCRYLCPYGALVAIFSLLGPGRIKRNDDICISCGDCTKVCPSFIKVDRLKQVISDECSGCLDCVDVCPADGSLELGTIGSKKRISKKAWALAIIILFWGSITIFKFTGPWDNSISTEEYIYHTERMTSEVYNHPGR
jgi:polyferredoxin